MYFIFTQLLMWHYSDHTWHNNLSLMFNAPKNDMGQQIP